MPGVVCGKKVSECIVWNHKFDTTSPLSIDFGKREAPTEVARTRRGRPCADKDNKRLGHRCGLVTRPGHVTLFALHGQYLEVSPGRYFFLLKHFGLFKCLDEAFNILLRRQLGSTGEFRNGVAAKADRLERLQENKRLGWV